MKTLIIILVFISSTFFALTDSQKENLLIGIKSDNIGLRTSCAYYIGKYNVDEGIIDLLRMLKEGKTPNERILAANCLVNMDSKRGIYAIKRASHFDESEQVRRYCKLVINYLKTN